MPSIAVIRPKLETVFAKTVLTPGQSVLVARLQRFLDNPDARVFLLKGYAGTGKTFLMQGLIRHLKDDLHRNVVLMAPTGRAAKVLSARTGEHASTMHSRLYGKGDDNEDADEFRLVSVLTVNTDDADTVYVVDESSMVSDVDGGDEFLRFGSGQLLSDFVTYFRDCEGVNQRKILFVGDAAQLPPVRMRVSPALDAVYLREQFNLPSEEFELTDIVRQERGSGIVSTASGIRDSLRRDDFRRLTFDVGKGDVIRVNAADIPQLYLESMGGRLHRRSVMIAHTNVRVRELNRAFRVLYFPGEETICKGDKVMVLLNAWIGGRFLCNGDFGQVLEASPAVEIRKVSLRRKAGAPSDQPVELIFRRAVIRFRDEKGELFAVDGMILENLLESEEGAESNRLRQALYADFRMRNPQLKRGTKEWNEAWAADKYVNALRVRYGYAVTCHKAQGGEWENVFVDCAWKARRHSSSYFRWLYTAVTRATSRLYLASAEDLRF